ncbi:Glyoxalase/bleomycin resistance protein/dioxygenase [uncultured Desulfobacterium sp.]|uniref:Glyoxalase/bleomycin resistance protein/dioxygenase n=1 Tax=uncultured Desulfobacterium sp. TaxID=201089 RepID=A0A445MZ10_9BACT|nr:Glyoxalase/bleomycin resistance protein/dioxygenase [uncultured Desulfobacterium sp.]
MTRFTGINHLAMVTSNMDMTIRFWRDLLGMRLVAGLGRPGYRHYFFEITDHDMIAFFEWADVEKIPEKDHGVPVKGPLAFDHVSIEVESDDDLWEIKGRLEAAEIWVSEVINHGFIHSIYAFDPNNIPIEFSAPVPTVDVRKNPKIKDKSPSHVALEGSSPQPGNWPEPVFHTSYAERRLYPGEGMILAEDHEPNEG